MKSNTIGMKPGQARDEFSKLKFAMSLDYIFGRGTSRKIAFDRLAYQYSRKTGRLRYILDSESKSVLFSFRANGSIAPTIAGAGMLLEIVAKRRPRLAVTVLDGVAEIVAQGRNVFCKHIVSCHKSLRAGEDVVVLSESGKLLAVGRSLVPSAAMKQFKRGVAINVREGVQGANGAVV